MREALRAARAPCTKWLLSVVCCALLALVAWLTTKFTMSLSLAVYFWPARYGLFEFVSLYRRTPMADVDTRATANASIFANIRPRISWVGRFDSSTRRMHIRMLLDNRTITINHLKARFCLANKTINILGDSVTRFQYLNLVYFLTTGLWESPDYPPNEMEPSRACPGARYVWTNFYLYTSPRLQTPTTSSVCDCFRVMQREDAIGRLENRFWKSNSERFQVNYFQIFDDWAYYYTNFTWLAPYWNSNNLSAVKDYQACSPGYCWPDRNKANVFTIPKGHLSDVLLNRSLEQNPDAVIFNEGTWRDITKDMNLSLPMLKRVGELVPKHTRLFFRTTNPVWVPIVGNNRTPKPLGYGDEDAFVREILMAQNAGWDYMDAFTPLDVLERNIAEGRYKWLPKSDNETWNTATTYDGVHAYSFALRGFNELLLIRLGQVYNPGCEFFSLDQHDYPLPESESVTKPDPHVYATMHWPLRNLTKCLSVL